MKFSGFLALIWAFLAVFFISSPAFSSPGNVICAGGNADTEVRFIFPLITENNSVNANLIVPFYTRDIILMYGPVGEQQKISFTRDDIIGLWLDDDRIDIRFYREEVNVDSEIGAFDLIVRTNKTDERDDESGWFIYRGDFLFRALAGPLREGRGDIVQETKGTAVCS